MGLVSLRELMASLDKVENIQLNNFVGIFSSEIQEWTELAPLIYNKLDTSEAGYMNTVVKLLCPYTSYALWQNWDTTSMAIDHSVNRNEINNLSALLAINVTFTLRNIPYKNGIYLRVRLFSKN